MSVHTQDPFPFPFGFGHPQEQQAKCYFCDEQLPVSKMAALPVGYFRVSLDISPTWQSDGTVAARALIGPGMPRNFRPPFLNGVPYVCKPCWCMCIQTDNVVNDSGVPFGRPWDEPPLLGPPPF